MQLLVFHWMTSMASLSSLAVVILCLLRVRPWASRSSRHSASPTIPAVSAVWYAKRVWMECLSPWTWRTTSTVSKTTTRKEDTSLLPARWWNETIAVSWQESGNDICIIMQQCQSRLFCCNFFVNFNLTNLFQQSVTKKEKYTFVLCKPWDLHLPQFFVIFKL